MEKLHEIVSAKRHELGLNQTEFGKLVGVSQKTVSDWETGKTAGMRGWNRLSSVLGIEENHLLAIMAAAGIAADKTERVPPAVRAAVEKMRTPTPPSIKAQIEPADGSRDIPVYGRAQGGPDGKFEFNGEIMGWEVRPQQLVGVRDAYAIYVDGDSMYPRYKPGETVWMNPSRPAKRGDDVIVQLYPDDENGLPYGFIKEFVAWTPQFLVVCQHNPAIEVRFARDEVKSIHVIVQAQRS